MLSECRLIACLASLMPLRAHAKWIPRASRPRRRRTALASPAPACPASAMMPSCAHAIRSPRAGRPQSRRAARASPALACPASPMPPCTRAPQSHRASLLGHWRTARAPPAPTSSAPVLPACARVVASPRAANAASCWFSAMSLLHAQLILFHDLFDYIIFIYIWVPRYASKYESKISQ